MMDDYKRTLYMIALRDMQESLRTKRPARIWLCVRLATILRREHQASAGAYIGSVDGLVQEFFPEFLELFDGTYWTSEGFADLQYSCAAASVWWQKEWLEPRIRILECLLRD